MNSSLLDCKERERRIRGTGLRIVKVMELLEFLNKAVTPYHCVEQSAEILKQAGFTEQKLTEAFVVRPGGSYFINLYGTGLAAYAVGEEFSPEDAVVLAVAHTDSPCLRIKPKAELSDGWYKRLDVEVYGSAILNTWYDRPLSVAGRVVLRGEDALSPKTVLLDCRRPLLCVPNLAIHMNREVNKGVEYKPQRDLLPLFGMFGEGEDKERYFLQFLARELNVEEKDILNFDLSVYCPETPCYLGEREEFISSPRLDNQVSCYALVQAMKNGSHKKGIHMAVLFDHEEIGSRSKQGADSAMVGNILERIYTTLGAKKESLLRAMAKGFLLSVDGAHALHPNRPESYDPVNRAYLNKGVVFKINSSQRYAFDAEGYAILQVLCEDAGIMYQKFANHNDIVGGSTLGPILSSWVSMRAVDIGIPMLAMHSIRELAGREDVKALERLVTEVFGGEGR